MSADLKSQQETATAHISDETLRRFMGYHMKRAFNVVQADLTRVLQPFELRMPTYTALVLIVDNAGLSQSQLADAMNIERPNLVVIVDDSQSMALTDHYGDGKSGAALLRRVTAAGFDDATRQNLAKTLLLEDDAALLQALERKYNVKLYALGSSARVQTAILIGKNA